MAKHSDDQRLELLQGTLDMLILRTLQWGPQHGHGIGQAIRAQSDELLRVETGSLYPALHRLVKLGWLKAEWGVSEANQRAKYYQLTAAGKAQLSRERDRWSQLVDAQAVIGPGVSAVEGQPRQYGESPAGPHHRQEGFVARGAEYDPRPRTDARECLFQ